MSARISSSGRVSNKATPSPPDLLHWMITTSYDQIYFWNWVFQHITVDDFVFGILHLVLFGWFFYGLYHQYARARFHGWIGRSIRKLRTASTTFKSWIFRKGGKLIAFVRKLRPTKPGTTQYVHMLSINSTAYVNEDIKVQLKRDESSWAYFSLAWTVLSVLYIAIDAAYHRVADTTFSTPIIVIDVAILTWLCFYCGWFRNHIARIVNHRNATPD